MDGERRTVALGTFFVAEQCLKALKLVCLSNYQPSKNWWAALSCSKTPQVHCIPWIILLFGSLSVKTLMQVWVHPCQQIGPGNVDRMGHASLLPIHAQCLPCPLLPPLTRTELTCSSMHRGLHRCQWECPGFLLASLPPMQSQICFTAHLQQLCVPSTGANGIQGCVITSIHVDQSLNCGGKGKRFLMK